MDRLLVVPLAANEMKGLNRLLVLLTSDLGIVLETIPCRCAWPSAGVSSSLFRRPRITLFGNILDPNLDIVDCLLVGIRCIVADRYSPGLSDSRCDPVSSWILPICLEFLDTSPGWDDIDCQESPDGVPWPDICTSPSSDCCPV
jgi:hypothetical protein